MCLIYVWKVPRYRAGNDRSDSTRYFVLIPDRVEVALASLPIVTCARPFCTDKTRKARPGEKGPAVCAKTAHSDGLRSRPAPCLNWLIGQGPQ